MKVDAQSLAQSLQTLDRSELYALSRSAADLKAAGGNNDGLWNEKGSPSMFGPAVLLDVEAKLRTGTSKVDEAQFVAQILAQKQKDWGGAAVTTLTAADLTDFTRFATKKAIDLARFDRHPSEVTEGFVKASGAVNGEKIAPRELFFQRFEPRADAVPSGKVIVLSPGFQETGRNFLEQIDAMNAAGHTVVAFDHQWSGHTKGGSPGGMDRLFGAARDVAAMAAHAAELLETDPKLKAHPGREVVLFGNSMGGAAALAAATLTDQGMLALDGGAKMPRGIKMVLQAPFVDTKPNLTNTLLRVGGQVPGFKDLQLPGIGLPVIAVDADASAKTKQEALLEKIVAQPETMVSGAQDMAALKALIGKGRGPEGQAVIVHARGDKLAAFSGSEWLDRQLGRGSELIAVDSKNHVMEQSAKDQGFALDGLERLLRGELKPTFGGSTKPAAPSTLGEWLTATAARVKSEVTKNLQLDSTGKIGWLAKNPPPTTDVTADFQALHAATRAGESPLPKNAGDFVYLMVPGLFTEHYPGYLGDNLERLAERGLDARKVDIDTDASVATNAKGVKKAILEAAKSGKQVVLIGHSKGGVDMSAALSLYPELKPHVRAAIAMQSPIGGTPIATDIQSCKELRPLVDRMIQGLFDGDPRALADLSYGARQAFLKDHPYPTDVPTISLATSSAEPLSLTAGAAAYVQHRYGEKCDGLVPVKDAIIPGSRVVQLDDLDHSGPAMRGPAALCKYRPADITEALIALALKD